jgi:hypothetical protein
MCDVHWKIEEFHRELKQLTGVEACHCHKARIQRDHIACALWVWTRLKTPKRFIKSSTERFQIA